jgi:hypothetical protein
MNECTLLDRDYQGKLHTHEIWGIFCTDAAGMVCRSLMSLGHTEEALPSVQCTTSADGGYIDCAGTTT